MGRRQCSNEYKLEAIVREIRRRIGKPGRAYIKPAAVDVMLGISVDEIIRMRPAKAKWMNNVFPLIDLGMRRYDCLLWLRRHGYPEPRKSSCLGCPYHRDPRYWRDLRDNHPTLWADCVAADREIRQNPDPDRTNDVRAVGYMHWQRVPLDEVDLSIDDRQGELFGEFGEECSGMCGV